MNLKTLYVGLNTNKQMVTKMSQTNMQKVLSEALIHEFKPFVFSNTYFISTSQANPAKFDKIMATK